jgi:hypothetical protein
MNCKPRKSVTLTGLPPGFLDNLPQEDQRALLDAVGKQVRLNGYDEHGRAELEFRDKDGAWHFIYLDPKLNLYEGTD